jgi:hypothetical protein
LRNDFFALSLNKVKNKYGFLYCQVKNAGRNPEKWDGKARFRQSLNSENTAHDLLPLNIFSDCDKII